MAKGTRAIQAIERSGVVYRLHEYTAERDDVSYGEAVAAALGVPPDRLYKTLVVAVDGEPVVAIVPVSGHLSLKKLAREAGAKRAAMIEPADAQRLTGYVVGGISPFGQRRRLPTYCDVTVTGHETIYLSAGRRGLQVELAPADLAALTNASIVDIAR
jgi:Cys-tRNA(Pro)/Cys-tRNA(Cys) deacylase